MGFFQWDQVADEVSGFGQLACLVWSSSPTSLAYNVINCGNS